MAVQHALVLFSERHVFVLLQDGLSMLLFFKTMKQYTSYLKSAHWLSQKINH